MVHYCYGILLFLFNFSFHICLRTSGGEASSRLVQVPHKAVKPRIIIYLIMFALYVRDWMDQLMLLIFGESL